MSTPNNFNPDDLNPANSRRSFIRYASLLAAAPIFTEAHFAMAAQQAAGAQVAKRQSHNAMPSDAVLINANENPLGPCKAACEKIAAIAPLGGRYDILGETDKLTKTFAAQHNLKEDHIAVYAGSSEPLHYTVLAFTSPTKGLVTADPSYEAPMRAAVVTQAKITKVPLTATYAHDVKALVAADPNAGVIYICNPNNPTGTITAKADIVWALENKPKGSILLVDEAYIHLSDAADVLDLVAAGKDLVVLRTFSKIYGMAGVRCGFAIGRPDLLEKIQYFGMNAMPIMAVAAATASLQDKDIVPQRKKINADIRNETFEWFTANNYSFISSETNCFMLQTNRPGREVMAAMAKQGVYIGRVWPVMPTYVRITVGTRTEMQKFQTAFKQVMNSSTAGLELPELPPRLRDTPFTHLS
jgi:histidinol-phosphate aminotransferase